MDIFDVLGFNLLQARALKNMMMIDLYYRLNYGVCRNVFFSFFFEISRFVDWMHDSIKQTQGDTEFSGEPMKINVQ